MTFEIKPDDEITKIVTATSKEDAEAVAKHESCIPIMTPDMYEIFTGYAMKQPIWVYAILDL